MRLDPGFSEFTALLLDHEVAFLVVGGFAIAARGHPRYSGDLDLWILVDRTNAERLIEALTESDRLGCPPMTFSSVIR
jgi:hypothetical protein